MDRRATLLTLALNCSCHQDLETLNGLSDAALTSIAANVTDESDKQPWGTLFAEGVVNGMEPEEASTLAYKILESDPTANAIPPQFLKGKKKKEVAEADEEETEEDDSEDEEEAEMPVKNAKKPQPTINSNPQRTNRMTLKQFLQTQATPEEQAVWNHAVDLEREGRKAIVLKLIANVQDDKQRQALGTKYMKKSLPELRELLTLVESRITSNTEEQQPDQINFSLAAGGPIGNRYVSDPDDILPLPTMNFNEKESQTATA